MDSMLFQTFYRENLIGGGECRWTCGRDDGGDRGNQRPMWFVLRLPLKLLNVGVNRRSKIFLSVIFFLWASRAHQYSNNDDDALVLLLPWRPKTGAEYYWGMFVKIAHWIDIGIIIVQLEWLSPAALRSYKHISPPPKTTICDCGRAGSESRGISWDERTHGPEEDINCPLGRKGARTGVESLVFGKGMYIYFFN